MDESDFREFIREERLRHEQANRRVERWLLKNEERAAVQISTLERMNALLEDLVAESRAQRAALFAVLDKLDSRGPPPAGA